MRYEYSDGGGGRDEQGGHDEKAAGSTGHVRAAEHVYDGGDLPDGLPRWPKPDHPVRVHELQGDAVAR